jgi:hypothetical protein
VKKLIYSLTVVVAIAIFYSSCSKEKALPPLPPYECNDTVTVSFALDVAPIFETHCYVGGGNIGCHSDWVFDWEGIERYGYFNNVKNRVITFRDMPPETNDFNIPALTYEQLNLIYCWYEQGALDN